MEYNEFINIIGYNKEWFEYNFLPKSFIEKQVNLWEDGTVKNVEHYKWAGYRFIIENEDLTKIERLNQLIDVVENDPNEHLYKGLISDLIRDKIITKKIFLGLGKKRFSEDKTILNKLGINRPATYKDDL